MDITVSPSKTILDKEKKPNFSEVGSFMNRNKGPLAAALGAKMSMEKKSASSDSSSRKSESGNRSPRKYNSSADRDIKGRARETPRRDNRYSEQRGRKDRDAKCRDKDSGRRDRDRDSKSSRYPVFVSFSLLLPSSLNI